MFEFFSFSDETTMFCGADQCRYFMVCHDIGLVYLDKKEISLRVSLSNMAVPGKLSKCYIVSCAHPSLVVYWHSSGGKYFSYQIFLERHA